MGFVLFLIAIAVVMCLAKAADMWADYTDNKAVKARNQAFHLEELESMLYTPVKPSEDDLEARVYQETPGLMEALVCAQYRRLCPIHDGIGTGGEARYRDPGAEERQINAKTSLALQKIWSEMQ